jgi:hypothetical protein
LLSLRETPERWLAADAARMQKEIERKPARAMLFRIRHDIRDGRKETK